MRFLLQSLQNRITFDLFVFNFYSKNKCLCQQNARSLGCKLIISMIKMLLVIPETQNELKKDQKRKK